ncbi:MAG: symmetrical bis(5'-nucleosyl)-tetraphosphatase [Acidobacteria bacterium]|nr:MAG: symmetrical bis(5'-nucleosyl)-tetraphosphatase [Acidobacteriota bacterium]
MATYAIGDVQGCAASLERLLEHVAWDPARDRLWFAGDLVNRGPRSLEVLRFVRGLGDTAVCVLGNHDLYLLALAEGLAPRRERTTVDDVLAAPDCEPLLAWLRSRPLIHHEGGFALVHAGILPVWSFPEAVRRAREVEAALDGPHWRALLAHWVERPRLAPRGRHAPFDRLVLALQAFTQLRVCTPDGVPALDADGSPEQAPDGTRPWFELRAWFEREPTILFGHWAALGFRDMGRFVALDSACVWGGRLTALRLDDRAVFSVPCDNDP